MRRTTMLTCAIVGGLAGCAGCRQGPPPPSHNRDLSDDGSVVLLPVAPPWSDPALKDGKAEWYAFTPPGEKAEPEETDSAEPAEDPKEAVAEIRELIGEYNGLVADGSVDDLIEYFLEEQQEAIKPHLQAGFALGAKTQALQKALEGKVPDQSDRIAAGCRSLMSGALQALEVDEITVVSDSELTGRMTLYGSPAVCRFILEEDTWFIGLPDLPDIAGVQPGIDQTINACDAWLGELQSGDGTGESVLAEMEQKSESMEHGRPPSEEGDEADSDDE